MKFVSEDGKFFETAKECIDYEKEAAIKEPDKEKRAADINKFIRKYAVLSKKLDDMIDAYAKDYPDSWEEDLDMQRVSDSKQEDVDVFDAARRGLIAMMLILELIADEWDNE